MLASPKGGQPPLDPKSNEPNFRTELTRRFEADAAANAQLASTLRLDSVKQEDFDTVFYPGGHGPMWDLAEDKNSVALLESLVAAGKIFAVVCHSTGTLRHVRTPDGKPFVEEQTVTGFTNGEEEEVELTKVVPFLVENEMMRLGATLFKVKNWGVHTVADGRLISRSEPGVVGPGSQASAPNAQGQVAALSMVVYLYIETQVLAFIRPPRGLCRSLSCVDRSIMEPCDGLGAQIAPARLIQGNLPPGQVVDQD